MNANRKLANNYKINYTSKKKNTRPALTSELANKTKYGIK